MSLTLFCSYYIWNALGFCPFAFIIKLTFIWNELKCHFFGNQYPDESLTQIYKEISIMTNCTCTVTECKHNDDHCCCKSEILVNTDSKNDCSCGCTCCASFDQKTSDSFKNSTQTPNPALKIGCNAVQCIHNENHLCQAESVAINGMNTQSGNHTECATFQAR